jgi:predicted secreted Zn-dependent protease
MIRNLSTLDRRAVVAIGLAILSAGCASAPRNPVLDTYPAGIVGHTTVLYYDVHGRTFDELRADMRKLGPKVADSSFVGETRSPMRWSWRIESANGTCSIRDVTVSVNAQITLPRWTPPADTEPGLAAEWNRFIAALETHEAGHKDISAKAGSEIVTRLRGLSGLCSQINTRAGDLARVIVDKASDDQRTYDAVTRHGLTQGTAFGAGRGRIASNANAPLTLLPTPRAGTVRGELHVPIERAWSVLRGVYEAAGLRVNAADSVAHALGDSILVHGMLTRFPVGDLVNCGTPPSGRNADSVDVTLFVTSRLEAIPPSDSWMMNTVQAVARPVGAPPIACRSLGTLERYLFDAMRGRLARSEP